jgi:hypothetical protein
MAVMSRSVLRRAGGAVLATGLLAAACGGSTAEPAADSLTAPAPDDTVIPSAEGNDTGRDGAPAAPTTNENGDDEGGGEAVGEAEGAPPAPGEAASFETVPSAPEPNDEPSGGDSPAEADGPAEPSAGEADGSEPPPNFHDDPRGGVFVDFQRGFDRDHPFGSLDAFCLPHDPPAPALQATGTGIDADTITLVHMRSLFEELVNIGLGVDVGDPTDMFDTYTGIVNERCGGVWGRHIDLRLVEASVLGMGGVDIDTLRNAACIEATEGHGGVIVMNTTTFQGTAVLCITEEHDSAFIGHEALPAEYVQRGSGRLLTTATTLQEILSALARYAIDSGALEGRRVGVVAPNTPGEAEAVESGLVAVLEAAGVDVAVFDILDCGGTSICVGGMAESVQRLADEGVDVLFPTLNPVSLPSYISEMVAQGFEPGDVQFLNSDFNNQGNEVVAGLVVTFGGAAAGALYDGAVMLVNVDTGRFRDPNWSPTVFDEMCMREYRENSAAGEDYDPHDPVGTNKFGMVGLVCSVYRTALRALYDAGPNPARADVFAALENLGAVDLVGMLPGSLAPGKWTMGDSLQPVTFRYPCPLEGLGTATGICMVWSDYSELRIKVN